MLTQSYRTWFKLKWCAVVTDNMDLVLILK